MENAAELIVRYDRLLSGADMSLFPYVSDDERMAEIVRDAGRLGVTLFWLKERLACKFLFNPPGTTEERLSEHYSRIPWSAPKHQGWQKKYRDGWNYDFSSDEWKEPAP